MSWSKKLDALNNALADASDVFSGITEDRGYDINLNKLPLIEQVEVIAWFKDGGTWSAWSRDREPRKAGRADTFTHLTMTKGHIRFNAGVAALDKDKNQMKHDWKDRLKDCSNLTRDDDSLLLYTLSQIPCELPEVKGLETRIAEMKSVFLSKMLFVKKQKST